MDELTIRTAQLPDTIEDLTQFVLVGKAKLQAYMLKLQAVNKLSVAQEIRDQTLKESQEISAALIAAEQRIGELLLAIPKASGGVNHYNKEENSARVEKTKSETISDMGYSKDEASDYQRMAKNPDIVQRVLEEAVANGTVATRTQVMKEIRKADESAREAVRQELAEKDRQIRAQEAKIRELQNQPPKVETVVKNVFPSDYEEAKAKAKSYDKDRAKWQSDYTNLANQRNKLQSDYDDLKRQTEEAKHGRDIRENAFSFMSRCNSFIGEVSKFAYIADYFDQLDENEKTGFYRAAKQVWNWSRAIMNTLENERNKCLDE